MSGERIIPENIKTKGEYYLYLKEVFIYEWCTSVIAGDADCLDLGCGDGYGTKLLSFSVKTIIGLDIDKELIRKASLKHEKPNCSFKAYDGAILSFSDDTFDVVTAFQVIEHIDSDAAFIAEVYRVLKKGGLFVLTTPNRAMRLPPGMAPWNIYHRREYCADELRALLENNFANVQILGVSAKEEVMEIERRRINKNIAVAKLDIFNLRRRLPLLVAALPVRLINYIFSANRKEYKAVRSAAGQVSARDIYSIEEIVSGNSLDILGICRK